MNSNQNENLPNSIVRIKEAAFKTNRSVEAMNCVICVWFHQCYIFSAQLSLLMDKRNGQMFSLVSNLQKMTTKTVIVLQEDLECNICLSECSADEMVNIDECRCSFCREVS